MLFQNVNENSYRFLLRKQYLTLIVFLIILVFYFIINLLMYSIIHLLFYFYLFIYRFLEAVFIYL